jgi:hypothetical protein
LTAYLFLSLHQLMTASTPQPAPANANQRPIQITVIHADGVPRESLTAKALAPIQSSQPLIASPLAPALSPAIVASAAAAAAATTAILPSTSIAASAIQVKSSTTYVIIYIGSID